MYIHTYIRTQGQNQEYPGVSTSQVLTKQVQLFSVVCSIEHHALMCSISIMS